MPAMSLTMSFAGAVAGLDSHIYARASTAAQGRYHNHPVPTCSRLIMQETLLSKSLADNVSTHNSGRNFGASKDRRLNYGNGCKRGVCRCFGAGNTGKDGNNYEEEINNETNDEVAGTSDSDNQLRQRKAGATTVKMGNPLREMIATAGQRLQDYLESYKQKTGIQAEEVAVSNTVTKEEASWKKLQELFSEVDELQNAMQKLQFQLEEAINLEEFEEAGRIKKKLAALIAKDLVAGAMSDFKKALKEERYGDAAYLRDEAGAGLVGWWAGVSESDDDPYGRIINISTSEGRFIAKGYSARQLALAASGVPLFEVYLTKDEENKYQQHAVYLQRDSNNAADSIVGFSKDVLDFENMLGEASKDMQLSGNDVLDFSSMLGEASRDMQLKLELLEDIQEDYERGINEMEGLRDDEEYVAMEEGLKKILDFLKDRMPDVKMKVFQVIANGQIEADLPNIVEQLMEDAEDELLRHEELAGAGKSNSGLQFIQSVDGFPPIGSFSMPSDGDSGSVEVEILGDEYHSRAPHRVPAYIERRAKDKFVFHIEESKLLTAAEDTDSSVALVAGIEGSSINTRSLDPLEEFLQNIDKSLQAGSVDLEDSEESDTDAVEISSKNLGDLLEKAVTRAQQRRGLFKSTLFQRINISASENDPFSGLYIGSLGPQSAEVVQLHRRYGNWQTADTLSVNQVWECFEYVEAVKLTGDVHVPAGEVSFRAKVGKGSRLPHRGVYPEELGVTARYKGQARMAEPGFKNPQWVDGELVFLNGKGGPTIGAELGFVYFGPGNHFLVLFGRLRLKC
ncbi:protein EXECUTER 2, chloroplastic isoform X1 [Physcomitrium patens]|uniref:protein EXECUTER 2, chloroplastic isoform X1 n=1 Tax=Physcomitrium patens TaxID=3218 RepID=UPI000D1511BA|nr:protein EXECUTER 2, chloroplastic-like isoform X1 [Physcomitrium patens]XP_024399466.1 protein EXECUTER 2, chloroplastic-like isoform X1 [Physcomitrium patens]XP_024399467.1 protein EXECUTER 2, chloroplastic-like isoform X1 [Physcomitrium patens]|eukprot:XP_024399465.1 protein EXECUTER 2, chloroplastic-like isoform X1 [Physcomitrella patens]